VIVDGGGQGAVGARRCFALLTMCI
jgi:hypothetical protein